MYGLFSREIGPFFSYVHTHNVATEVRGVVGLEKRDLHEKSGIIIEKKSLQAPVKLRKRRK